MKKLKKFYNWYIISKKNGTKIDKIFNIISLICLLLGILSLILCIIFSFCGQLIPDLPKFKDTQISQLTMTGLILLAVSFFFTCIYTILSLQQLELKQK